MIMTLPVFVLTLERVSGNPVDGEKPVCEICPVSTSIYRPVSVGRGQQEMGVG